MSDVRLIAISLACRSAPLMSIATVSESAVHIIETIRLPRSIPQIREKIAEVKSKASKQDAVMFIEDPTGLIKDAGYAIRIDDKHTDNRPVLVVAMERYQALLSMNALTFPLGKDNKYTISDSLLNIKLDTSGNTIYQIDWPQLKDESRLMLLLIFGGMCQNPYHSSYLSSFFAELNRDKVTASPQRSIFSMFRGLTDEINRDSDSLAGTKISDNVRIL